VFSSPSPVLLLSYFVLCIIFFGGIYINLRLLIYTSPQACLRLINVLAVPHPLLHSSNAIYLKVPQQHASHLYTLHQPAPCITDCSINGLEGLIPPPNYRIYSFKHILRPVMYSRECSGLLHCMNNTKQNGQLLSSPDLRVHRPLRPNSATYSI
jgi:hypothetical protein